MSIHIRVRIEEINYFNINIHFVVYCIGDGDQLFED